MKGSLPVPNWSLQRLLGAEKGAFNKARVKILYTFLGFSLLKVFVVLAVSTWYMQYFQLTRALVFLAVYGVLFAQLLTGKGNVTRITHTLLSMGMLLVWSNIFITVGKLNIVTLQFIFMIIMSSFYLLPRRQGLIYTILAIVPVLIHLLLLNRGIPTLSPATERAAGELALPGAMAIILLNFTSIVVSSNLYHRAFSETMAEKETLNLQLKLAVDEANRHAQSRSDFLSTMSHELRTPLNSVIGMAELLLEDAHNEEQKENLGILRFSALSLHTLINDILDFNKLGSGRLQLESIPVNLSKLLRNICSGMELQAKEKGLKLELLIDPALENLYLVTDPTRITQIIYNLAGNGIKFTHKGGITIALALLHKTDEGVKVRFAITDTGIGIAADKQETVFEPFVQASTSTTRNYGGTGLGLPIVKRLLALFGSDIVLESRPGEGSRFSFEIMFAYGESPVPAVHASEAFSNDLQGLRVLAAEDNPMNVLLLRKLCQRWKIKPDIVENGTEVLPQLEKHMYDVILMDIHMPGMDGYEASRAIRKLPDRAKARIPIIALTASVSNDIHAKITAAGMNDYVRKPFNAKDLFVKLDKLRVPQVQQA